MLYSTGTQGSKFREALTPRVVEMQGWHLKVMLPYTLYPRVFFWYSKKR